MRNPVFTILGVVIALAGALFFLQGIDLIKGSGMSGTVLWSILGPLIFLAGVALVLRGVRGEPGVGRDDL